MYNTKEFSNQLKKLRKNRWELCKNFEEIYEKYNFCKSQETFAERLGVERRTISSWENGTTFPSIETIVLICNILDCPIEFLLNKFEIPEIAPISNASLYSGISTEIIREALRNPEYLDFLNFFMHPENCSSLLNGITLSNWKQYWINTTLQTLRKPLKKWITNIFKDFIKTNPFYKITEHSYKTFLKSKLPEASFSFVSKQSKTKITIKVKETPELYTTVELNGIFDYSSFIGYLANQTYMPLIQAELLELEKNKLANSFLDLFAKYIEQSDT
ncbi:helix-turn-helix transcriptional regulator [Mediterraneibacter gnavus]|jgi:transcriptional regulator with XRE-family HTH domain|uniref:HTH cro/C1-type domain-containing protein n=1 Tax=Mediterraneibacter gnavus TaxID=33038 RepID=A0A2N5NLY5_MEDGN|nr:helix-turn-helix transcriptional regulator [Mediterraneibacter gnavus]PLT57136.1 hypothetical protein CDL22_02895 [Mediterraneibacter gnavus]PLT57918.1 hypothetical protein CDL18_02895 [Mediterraneibacter gnavus]